jgi:hypothetical protein
VDELSKLGGSPCRHQRVGDPGGGCGIHASRPGVCRAYRCLWLRGGLGSGDRPDRLGAVLDLMTEGDISWLVLHESSRGAYDRSPRLQEIAARFRDTLPVRVIDSENVLDPDRPFRVLLPGGEEHRVEGERTVVFRDGVRVGERCLPWLDRWLRRVTMRARRRRLRRHGDGAASRRDLRARPPA